MGSETNNRPQRGADRVVRSLTVDGAFRVITAITTDTVRGAIAAQDAEGETARWLGELITGAVLIREAVSPDRRVQILIKDDDGRTQLVADSNPTGWNRGIVGPGARVAVDAFEYAVLEVLYTLPNNIMQQGVVRLPENADVSTGLMTYMQESEQIVTTIATRTIIDHQTTVRAAGGFLVQLMPDASEDALRVMTDTLERFTSLDTVLSHGDVSPTRIRDHLLGELETREMAQTYLCFGCNCDHERILRGLATLADEDIEEMIDDAEDLEIQCDVCGKYYAISTDDLEGLLRARHGSLPDN